MQFFADLSFMYRRQTRISIQQYICFRLRETMSYWHVVWTTVRDLITMLTSMASRTVDRNVLIWYQTTQISTAYCCWLRQANSSIYFLRYRQIAACYERFDNDDWRWFAAGPYVMRHPGLQRLTDRKAGRPADTGAGLHIQSMDWTHGLYWSGVRGHRSSVAFDGPTDDAFTAAVLQRLVHVWKAATLTTQGEEEESDPVHRPPFAVSNVNRNYSA